MAGAIAGGKRRVDVLAASLAGTGGGLAVELARSRTVALAIRSAARRAGILAGVAGVAVPRRDHRAVTGEDVTAQLRQPPVQALSQQTPSTHWPDLHSLALLQVCPSCLGPQVPFTQAIPVSQSVSFSQVPVQAAARQTKGEQFCRPGGRQVPSPSQVPGVLRRVPGAGGGHTSVSAAGSASSRPRRRKAHWSHSSPRPGPYRWRSESGLPGRERPAGALEPRQRARTHGPWQATLQQMLLAQKFERQSLALVRPPRPGDVCHSFPSSHRRARPRIGWSRSTWPRRRSSWDRTSMASRIMVAPDDSCPGRRT